ncbi:hypothetical protein ONZ45_g9133 [Pleurotus djamor]|nr:hypothetical protein ONZ45_g9133 [Pleurotus djamor]
MKAPFVPMLAHLLLEVTYEGNHLPISWLLDLLQNIQHLETLKLGKVSANTTTTVNTPISLPKLKSLELTLNSLRASQLLTYIDMPRSTRANLKFLYDDEDTPTDVNTGFLDLKTFTANRVPPSITFLEVAVLIQQFSSHTDYKLTIRDYQVNTLLCVISIASWSVSAVQQHVGLVASLPLHKIRTLLIQGCVQDSEVVYWSTLIPLLDHLRSIRVGRTDILQFLQPSSPDGSDSNTESSNLPCNPAPMLEKIFISHDIASTPRDWAHFVRTCQMRQENGKPLRNLTIVRSDVPKLYLTYFSECVMDVAWDEEGIDDDKFKWLSDNEE